MILRVWRGRALPTKAFAYPAHFRQSVLPELKGIAGFLGAYLLRQERTDGVEFMVLTKWTSMQAIQAFAGKDVGKAVVEPAAVAALAEFDETVQHYEVAEDFSP
jgi:heme-degrading monooxygenase HmoA